MRPISYNTSKMLARGPEWKELRHSFNHLKTSFGFLGFNMTQPASPVSEVDMTCGEDGARAWASYMASVKVA